MCIFDYRELYNGIIGGTHVTRDGQHATAMLPRAARDQERSTTLDTCRHTLPTRYCRETDVLQLYHDGSAHHAARGNAARYACGSMFTCPHARKPHAPSLTHALSLMSTHMPV